MSQWFDTESPVMTALAELLDWFLLSLLTLVCSVPLITVGPAWAALYKVMEERVNGSSRPVLRNYFAQFRGLFRPALVNWLLFIAAGCFLFAEFRIVANMPDGSRVLFWAGAFLLTFCLILTGTCLLPLLCTHPTLPYRRLWKAAFIQGVARLPRSLEILSALLRPGIVFFFSGTWFWLLFPLWLFLWPAVTVRLWVRLTAPLFRNLPD